MISSDLQKAMDILQIEDVYLRDTLARCADDFDPKYNDDYDSLSFTTQNPPMVVTALTGRKIFVSRRAAEAQKKAKAIGR